MDKKCYIARDYDGGLFLYFVKPKRGKRGFFTERVIYGAYIGLPSFKYPEVTWDNSPKVLIISND